MGFAAGNDGVDVTTLLRLLCNQWPVCPLGIFFGKHRPINFGTRIDLRAAAFFPPIATHHYVAGKPERTAAQGLRDSQPDSKDGTSE